MLKIREIQPKIGFIGERRENILEDLNFAVDNGFEYYEVASRKIFNLKPEVIKKAKWISERYNISLNFHIPYFLEISSYIPGISEIVLKFAKKEIVLANKLGAKIITIHSGYKEAKILFDVDKLDAIGAVGIGRAFLFAGEIGAKLHDKNVDIKKTKEYTKDDSAYREYLVKLRKIKNRMFTKEGKKIAREKHGFMVNFFNRLNKEIDGKL